MVATNSKGSAPHEEARSAPTSSVNFGTAREDSVPRRCGGVAVTKSSLQGSDRLELEESVSDLDTAVLSLLLQRVGMESDELYGEVAMAVSTRKTTALRFPKGRLEL
ncbi:hypothetical protein M6B38_100795 [Iris pallida]|uniref:Uncharacterized protein n=1 Tax=Iris pallida TaxID=29817 RepID=A0AAX6IM12_IRIPA|nr:hypothetical protein M6B38_100795 [Iris pallida]